MYHLRNRIAAALALIAVSSALAPLFVEAPALAKVSGKNTKDPSDKNLRLGKDLWKKKDYDGAIDALLQSIYFARNGYAPEAYYYLGLCYQAKEMDVKAVDALTHHLTQTMDKAAPGHLALAQVYTHMKAYEKANEQIALAFADSSYDQPIYSDIYLAQGQNQEAMGRPQAALDSYRQALGDYRKEWDRYDAWIRYAECLMKIKEWVKAYQTLSDMTTTKAPLVGIQYDRVHLDIGICLLTKGSHQGAIENWHKALQYEPDNKEVHLQLAMIFEAERHLSSAAKEYKEFIRCAKDSDPQRVHAAQQRIQVIEQKLSSESNTPSATSASPYMRAQEEKAEADAQRASQEQLKNLPSDAGF